MVGSSKPNDTPIKSSVHEGARREDRSKAAKIFALVDEESALATLPERVSPETLSPQQEADLTAGLSQLKAAKTPDDIETSCCDLLNRINQIILGECCNKLFRAWMDSMQPPCTRLSS